VLTSQEPAGLDGAGQDAGADGQLDGGGGAGQEEAPDGAGGALEGAGQDAEGLGGTQLGSQEVVPESRTSQISPVNGQ
jgi:hypothetical protein